VARLLRFLVVLGSLGQRYSPRNITAGPEELHWATALVEVVVLVAHRAQEAEAVVVAVPTPAQVATVALAA
jgi:hypothetical protein